MSVGEEMTEGASRVPLVHARRLLALGWGSAFHLP
jgi:hypothetical protein